MAKKKSSSSSSLITGVDVVLGDTRKRRPSEAQLKTRLRFEAAQAYAKRVLSDPLKREAYRRLAAGSKRAPNTLLISNFLTPPTIEAVDADALQGNPGDVVRVLASDPIEVVSVSVALHDAAGRVLESGAATKDHGVWEYRCTTALYGIATKIEITAVNRAGTKGVVRGTVTW